MLPPSSKAPSLVDGDGLYLCVFVPSEALALRRYLFFLPVGGEVVLGSFDALLPSYPFTGWGWGRGACYRYLSHGLLLIPSLRELHLSVSELKNTPEF